MLTDYASHAHKGIVSVAAIDNLQRRVGEWVPTFMQAASHWAFRFETYLAKALQQEAMLTQALSTQPDLADA
jgi:hypothetical protein